MCEPEPGKAGVQQTWTALTPGCLISAAGLLGKSEKKKAETSNSSLRVEGDADSPGWLDNSLPILEISMQLFPDGVPKSKVLITKPPQEEPAVVLFMENDFFCKAKSSSLFHVCVQCSNKHKLKPTGALHQHRETSSLQTVWTGVLPPTH